MKWMANGKALIEYAAEDNLDGFQRVFAFNCKDKFMSNMMYWHV